MTQQRRAGEERRQAIQQFLTFRIGDDVYGIDILRVREIRGWNRPREIPDMPAFIKGVIDFRGGIVPIIDLRLRFALGTAQYDRETVVILVSVQQGDKPLIMGMVVDRVADVMNARQEDIKARPSLGARLDARYMRGIVKREEDMVLLIDVDALMDPDTFGRVAEMGRHG